jgi:type II secretory pathway pseudopilin PulG
MAKQTLQRGQQSGMSLLETMIALTILLIASAGILTMAAVAMVTTEDQGHLMARATEYAQDKMEQLISLSYGDSTTDTTVFPAANTGGTGLAVGGGTDFSAPTASYVDYLDRNGNQLTITGGVAPANWFFIRVWSVALPTGTTNLKQISVASRVRATIGKPSGALPQTTLVSIKTSPF